MARTLVHLDKEDKQYIRDNINKISQKEMAEWIGCHPITILRFIKKENLSTRKYEKWTLVKRNQVLILRRYGMTSQEIADILNVSYGSIRGQLNIMRKEGSYNVPSQGEWRRIRMRVKNVETL